MKIINVQTESRDMYTVIQGLPLFNSYNSSSLEELIEYTVEDCYITEEFINAIRTLDVKNLDGLYIDDEIKVKVI